MTRQNLPLKILFVDDEEYLVDVGREMLEDHGYAVDITTSAAQALEWTQKAPDRYGLLITDYTMPEMAGDVFIERIHALSPGLPVILCTGIEPPPKMMENVAADLLLMKPFDMDSLIHAVEKIFGSPQG